MTVDNQKWHEIRATNIGASEVAALFAESPYLSAYSLWHIKKGIIKPDDIGGNERVIAGNMLEPAILAWAKFKYEMDFVSPKAYYKHQTVEGMGCTPDAILLNNPHVIAQAKNVDAIQFGRKWKTDGDDILECPVHIFLQCQQEMACTGAEQNHLLVLVGGNRLCRMIIERDNDLIAEIEKRITDFWASIASNTPPSPDYKYDGETIIKVKGKVVMGDYADKSNDEGLAAACAAYDEASRTIKEAEDAKNQAKAQIMDKCLGYDVVSCARFEVKIVKTSATPDKVITPDMVGQVMKGRSGSTYPRIKEVA